MKVFHLRWHIWQILYFFGIYKHPRLKFNAFQASLLLANKYSNSGLNAELINKKIKKTTATPDILALLESFKNKYGHLNKEIKIVILSPKIEVSPGGFSLYKNMYESLVFLGISTRFLTIDNDIKKEFLEFKPTFLLSYDFQYIYDKIDIDFIQNYRKNNTLIWGINAYLQEYGYNTPLQDRVNFASKIGINFYYTFRSLEYCKNRAEYAPIFDANFKVISIEFGANPLKYYPIKNEKIFDYVFVGSSNKDKWLRYEKYFKPIFSTFKNGVLYGPGWLFCKDFVFDNNVELKLYSASKVGLNLHIDNQLDWASELNERTYQLGLCKLPQLIDHPKLLFERYPKDCFFVAENEIEYSQLLQYMLENPAECEIRAQKAYLHTLQNHTCLHRAETLIVDLLKIKNN